jgi:hypothetical protein
LVDYVPYAARTRFQRHGIRGADLCEEDRNTLIEQGIDPDEIDFSGTDLEVKVTNRDTLRRQWQEIMDVCYKDPSGLPGKTIVFALTQAHALRLAGVFEEMYPSYPGLARVITYQTKYARREIKKFKTESKPRIAISVDMLETGIDVPEAVDLVFMRPVRLPHLRPVKQPPRHAAKDQAPLLRALGGELVQREAQRVAVSLAVADRGKVAAPHHPLWAKRLVRHLHERWYRLLEGEGLRDRHRPRTEFAQPA